MTIEQARAAIIAFETTTLPPMCREWHIQRKAAVQAGSEHPQLLVELNAKVWEATK